MEKRSFLATSSAVIGLLSVAGVVIGAGGAHTRLLTPYAGFQLFGIGLVPGATLALVTGLLGLLRTRSGSGRTGRGRAWLGLGLAAALLGVLAVIGSSTPGRNAPVIHDVTTDIEDPPTFSDAVRNAEDRVNGVDYPDGGPDVPDLQRAAYPDIAPIELHVPPILAFRRARDVAESLAWQVTKFDTATMVMEAKKTSRVFRFVDDIVVRVRPRDVGSVVDIRSNSRVGRGDIGANAARIREFSRKMQRTGNRRAKRAQEARQGQRIPLPGPVPRRADAAPERGAAEPEAEAEAAP